MMYKSIFKTNLLLIVIFAHQTSIAGVTPPLNNSPEQQANPILQPSDPTTQKSTTKNKTKTTRNTSITNNTHITPNIEVYTTRKDPSDCSTCFGQDLPNCLHTLSSEDLYKNLKKITYRARRVVLNDAETNPCAAHFILRSLNAEQTADLRNLDPDFISLLETHKEECLELVKEKNRYRAAQKLAREQRDAAEKTASGNPKTIAK